MLIARHLDPTSGGAQKIHTLAESSLGTSKYKVRWKTTPNVTVVDTASEVGWKTVTQHLATTTN